MSGGVDKAHEGTYFQQLWDPVPVEKCYQSLENK